VKKVIAPLPTPPLRSLPSVPAHDELCRKHNAVKI
jgi:hypothetical protein